MCAGDWRDTTIVYHTNYPAPCCYGMPLETIGMNHVQWPLKNMLTNH